MNFETVKQFVFMQALAVCLCAKAGAEPIAYTNENAFLGDIEAAGYVYIREGFEDDDAWGQVRSTISGGSHVAPAVTNFSVRFSANTNTSSITTSHGPPRTGQWGGYSLPHGSYATGTDCDIPGNCGDGVVAASDKAMYALGVWVEGTHGGKLEVILNGDRANPVGFPEICDSSGENCIDYGLLASQHKFFGVVATEGFAQCELREMEGTAEDQKFIWCDDFIVAFSNPPPPRISDVTPTNQGLVLQFKELAIPAQYTLQHSLTLMPNDWSSGEVFTATTTQTNRIRVLSNDWNRAYFRLRSP